jgi:uncharacterized protein (DUF433 family)
MQNSVIMSELRDEPLITGTDVTVACILENLSSGDSIDKICGEHDLTREQVHAALSFAEMNLPHTNHYKALDSMLKDAAPGDELDYSLLSDNAGYFGPDTCSLHLLHRYRKINKRHSPNGGHAIQSKIDYEL